MTWTTGNEAALQRAEENLSLAQTDAARWYWRRVVEGLRRGKALA